MSDPGNLPNMPHHSEMAEGEISLDEILALSPSPLTHRYRISGPGDLDSSDTLIRGKLSETRAPSGICVHATDTVEAHDLVKEWEMQPALMIAVVLDGRLEVRLEDQPLTLGGGPGPTGHFWHLEHPGRITRISKRGTHVRKAVIRVPPAWVSMLLNDYSDPARPAPEVFTHHLAHGQWQPSAHVIALTEQLINQQRQPRALQIMSAECKAAEIAREALTGLLSGNTGNAEPMLRETARARTIRNHILDNLHGELALAPMGAALGMSIGSMQSAFKKSYGQTIGDYVRELRLNQARSDIEEHGLSVSEAGYRAGYDSPAAFSTAFRRRFGMAPSGYRS